VIEVSDENHDDVIFLGSNAGSSSPYNWMDSVEWMELINAEMPYLMDWLILDEN